MAAPSVGLLVHTIHPWAVLYQVQNATCIGQIPDVLRMTWIRFVFRFTCAISFIGFKDGNVLCAGFNAICQKSCLHTKTVMGGSRPCWTYHHKYPQTNWRSRSLKPHNDRNARNRLGDLELEMVRYKFLVSQLKLHNPRRVMQAGLIFTLILGLPLFLVGNMKTRPDSRNVPRTVSM